MSTLSLLVISTYGCGTTPDRPDYDLHDMGVHKVSQDGAREPESFLEAAPEGTAPKLEEPIAYAPMKPAAQPDRYKTSTSASAASERTGSPVYAAGGLRQSDKKKGPSRSIIETSVNASPRLKACIINGKLQIAGKSLRPMPRGKRRSLTGKVLSQRIDRVLLDPESTRAALEAMLSDWGERAIRVDDALVQHVSYFLKYLALCERESTRATLERSKKYFPKIKQVFAKHRLPEDLAFAVPFVESRFTETAQSSAGAVGMFQFLAPTARDYGVAVTCDLPWEGMPGVDERLDWNKTCVAAARYLSDHRKMFNSTLLALGAYHHGAATVTKVLAAVAGEGKEKSFRSIFICDQLEAYSREYIPLCLAAAYLHRLVKEAAAIRMPNLKIQYVSIKKPTPLDKLSAQHRDLTTNNPDLAFADQLYCYASTGGYLLITELKAHSPKQANSRLYPLTIARGKP
jgi:hypothetical protein